MSDKTLVTVRLRSALFRGSLHLARTPKFLRFTCSGLALCSRNWDALDQLDDEAQDGETLVAGVLAHRGSVHVDRTVKGRRVGEWWPTAEYEQVSPQPDQATMRDGAKWRQWCEQQVVPICDRPTVDSKGRPNACAKGCCPMLSDIFPNTKEPKSCS